jgi:hypothetical protein
MRLPRSYKSAKALLLSGALLIFATQTADAGLIPFFLTDFSLVNSNADGTATSTDAGSTLTLVGGNNGGGLAGTTDFIAISAMTVTFQFDYTYQTLDAPGFDRAGYWANQVLTFLADEDGRSGTVSVTVNAGEDFGFRIETDDNTGEPGVLKVGTFQAVSVPEPDTRLVVPLLISAMAWAANRRCRTRQLNKRG